MTNPPKKKGTAFESAVVAHITEAGFPAQAPHRPRRVVPGVRSRNLLVRVADGNADMTQALAAVAGVTLTAIVVLGLVVALVAVQDWRRFRP